MNSQQLSRPSCLALAAARFCNITVGIELGAVSAPEKRVEVIVARPKVFISSTYYDLKHIRASLEVFVDSLGFDSVLFEKGDIAFHPDSSLDESCYREARSADIFVLIVGGRYGSAASKQINQSVAKPRYESITQREFESAQEADVPTFILIDGAVHAEFDTFKRNRENDSVHYAHVDSPSVFLLIESIFERGRNNPVFAFERATDIEAWLREQWAGLFRELLRTRSQQRQLSALNAQVQELQSLNSTLKNYMEAVLTKVTPDDSEKIIDSEEQKLAAARIETSIRKNPLYRHLVRSGLDDESARELIEKPANAAEVADLFEEIFGNRNLESPAANLLWQKHVQKDFNEARSTLHLPQIDFDQHSEITKAISKALRESSDEGESRSKTISF